MSTGWKSKNWIAASSDRLHPGRHIHLGIERWIFRKRSRFQEVAIGDVPGLGPALFLDAVLELASEDEFIYHENLVLPALLRHPSPRRVLIQGGGDGLALREVLRDPRVEEVYLVELDELVVAACREHLRPLHRGSFDDPRLRLRVLDVFEFLQTTDARFDVVYIDLLDIYDRPSLDLYRRVLENTEDVLSEGAIVAGFGDLALPHVPARHVLNALRARFDAVEVRLATIESFAGQYAFFCASHRLEPGDSAACRARADDLAGPIRSFTPELVAEPPPLPPYVAQLLQMGESPPRASLAESFSWLE